MTVAAADIAACRTACMNMPGCAAFDFTTVGPTCTLYQAPIACLRPLIVDATATFEVVRLDLCPFMPPGSIPAKFDTQDAGFTIPGGMANSANNITACVAACSTGCFGISFDYSSTASTRCFLLMTMTAVCMTPLVPSSAGVVYRVACPVGTGLPAKFGTSMLNMELMGGTTVPQARTLQSCAANCGSSCIAITFDTATLMCRTHFSATGCNAAVTNLNAITVRCAVCNTAPGANTTTCFGNMETLTCATGIVSIASATYGRVVGSQVCLPNMGNPPACTEPNIFPIVQSICNNNAGTCNVMNSINTLQTAAMTIPIGFAGCMADSSPVLMIQYNCVSKYINS
ncbi:uncharacterized protein LOC106176997 [Lingula anatina]|uniref:Uncharacterized protein LOC106176997 n=1 Tax=Lingula anatina TaxID=7574 RepID=A0A1S3JXG0_LINAN|nr:uncharacterized protein LOC106176997 [Lingula anatina]|eukprot:XP_013415063.1 uncharacterized protein LOC106176997 [Lingula anatina]